MVSHVASDDDGESVNVTEALRSHFKARSAAAHAADFAMGATLGAVPRLQHLYRSQKFTHPCANTHHVGQGAFGRVRIAESPEIKDKFARHQVIPYFAIKILKKSEIIRLKQGEHVKAERDLLLNKINHPFMVTSYGTYKDERNLYMILEYVPGGELLAKCRANTENLPNEAAKFYAAQLVMALQYLHADHIIYRGMVPDNLLIDKLGYLKLVDFGFAKKLPVTEAGEGMTYTLCGTAEYLSPEIVNSKGHGKGADWWALGVVIYEMLAGYPPFYAQNPFEIYQQVLKAQPMYPSHFDTTLCECPDAHRGARTAPYTPRCTHRAARTAPHAPRARRRRS